MRHACVGLDVEELESRTLPSATTLAPPALSAALVAPSSPLPPLHLLSGQGEGTFGSDAIQSGAGTESRLWGEGQFAGLGHVGIRGSVHAVGFLVHGQAAGTLTLTNDHGSVTLALTGPDQPGFSALPEHFSYQVTGGTKAYAHLSDQGTLALELATEPNGLGVHATGGSHGAFSLSTALPGQPGAALNGALAGHFTPAPVAVDAGAFYSLSGTGTLAGAGPVSLTGTLQATGFVQRGHATGELTITGPGGSVTLGLRGPVQGGFASLPGQFDFTVRSGTGAYAHLHAGGTVTIRLDAQDGTFTLAVLSA